MTTFADIYARVPSIVCKGLCHTSCGPVPATNLEIEAIEKKSFVPWGVDAKATCSMLFAGRCTVYTDRPLICRIYGTAESLSCPYGCVPERVMSDDEAHELIELAGEIGGGYDLERVASMLGALK